MDGMIRSVDARLGTAVRESQELVLFDATEANASLQSATAELKEKRLMQKRHSDDLAGLQVEAAEARVEAGKGRWSDRCDRPRPLRLAASSMWPVCPDSSCSRGTIDRGGEVADTSSRSAVLPVDRRVVAVGSDINVPVEEQEVSGKVAAVLPLPESFAVLRELATPYAAASVVFPNSKGQLDAGYRARPAGVPVTALANIPRRAVHADDLRGAANFLVQVIRNEYVTNIPVHVLGPIGPDRVQVSGQFRRTDALIVGSSVSLIPGTLVRIHDGAGGRGIEDDLAKSRTRAGSRPTSRRPAGRDAGGGGLGSVSPGDASSGVPHRSIDPDSGPRQPAVLQARRPAARMTTA